MKVKSPSQFRTTFSGAQTMYQNIFHLVFSTRYRKRVLTPNVKLKIRNWMKQQEELLGIRIILMNGYLDHLHVLVIVPPKVSISQVAHGIKGYSSRMLGKSFYWQRGYYVKAISKSEFKQTYLYIRDQYFHHLEEKITVEEEIESFEKIGFIAA